MQRKRSTFVASLIVTVAFMGTVMGCQLWVKGGGRAPGDDAKRLEGRIVASANETVFLLTSNNERYLLQSYELSDELAALNGMDVALVATRVPDAQPPTIDVHSYELLAMPSGEVPIIGILYKQMRGELGEADLLLITEDGAAFLLIGDLVAELDSLAGSKVWVAGALTIESFGVEEEGLYVTQFGVIRESRNRISGEIEAGNMVTGDPH